MLKRLFRNGFVDRSAKGGVLRLAYRSLIKVSCIKMRVYSG
jgi:hypothetical protein